MMKILKYIFAIPAILLACCCSDKGTQGEDGINLAGVTLPESVSASIGDKVQCWGKGFLPTDTIILEGEGKTFVSPVIIDSERKFSFTIPEGFASGTYSLVLERDGQRKPLGKMYITILSGTPIPDKEGMNIKGVVYDTDKNPIGGVVVSDGYEVTRTDGSGRYWLASEKTHGYVFISVPSGYECIRNGVIPAFFRHLSSAPGITERCDFELKKRDQSQYRMLIFGDMHLANRTNEDVRQFQDVIADVNALTSRTSVPVYGLTLGDMTWDTFWYTELFEFPEYLAEVGKMNGLPIFHTIGNHDHEYGKAGYYPSGDFETAKRFKDAIGPTYYSFNIGNEHYVVLDDIKCLNDGKGGTKIEISITPEQVEWLKKDLEAADKDCRLIAVSHSQFYDKKGNTVLRNASEIEKCFEGFRDVHVFTGHTHLVYNVEKQNLYEHNAGAVCATWWWSGKHTGLQICQDGAPGGYTVADFSGNGFSWKYKGIGLDENVQFRCYDGNSVYITADEYGVTQDKSKFNGWAAEYPDWTKRKTDNKVYINIWNWDSAWKLKVTENGQELSSKKVTLRDPLHLIAYTAKSMNQPTFATSQNLHFFEVQASSPTSTLEIEVTDRFGNIYKETMERPRAFSIEQYK